MFPFAGQATGASALPRSQKIKIKSTYESTSTRVAGLAALVVLLVAAPAQAAEMVSMLGLELMGLAVALGLVVLGVALSLVALGALLGAWLVLRTQAASLDCGPATTVWWDREHQNWLVMNNDTERTRSWIGGALLEAYWLSRTQAAVGGRP